ncbi:MAG: hypothetical protein ACTJGD_07535 [Mesonia hippocampi]|uniref:hypothetical protein n=1 Tax=Mesonia hippocampi TaxID=1628250 RepID=UPI003F9BDFC1
MQKINLLLLGVVFLCFGCKDFETKKVSSTKIVEEELKHIDWKAIEQYPSFEVCKKTTEKQQQKACFEQHLSAYIYEELATHQVISNDSINQKIVLYIKIDATGKPNIDSIQAPKTLFLKLPELSNWLTEAVVKLPKIFPAQKRGIPVSTNYKLPLQIVTQ